MKSCEACAESRAQSQGYHPRCMKHENEHRDATRDMPRKEFYRKQWDEQHEAIDRDKIGQYPEWIEKL